MDRHDIPIACDLSALPDRAQHDRVTHQLIPQAVAVTPLADGYQVTFPVAALTLAAAFIDGERRCCPFIHFRLDIVPAAETLQIAFTGRAGVKAFLEQELLPNLPVAP